MWVVAVELRLLRGIITEGEEQEERIVVVSEWYGSSRSGRSS